MGKLAKFVLSSSQRDLWRNLGSYQRMQGIHFGFWSSTVSHQAFECFALALIITLNSVLSFFSYPFCASLIPIRSLATFSPREIGQQSRPSGIPTTGTMNLRLRLWSFALQSSKAFCALCLSVKTCSAFARLEGEGGGLLSSRSSWEWTRMTDWSGWKQRLKPD